MGTKFPNGQRTLKYQDSPPLFWRVNVDDDGMDTPTGRYAWASGEGRYVKSSSQKVELLEQCHQFVHQRRLS